MQRVMIIGQPGSGKTTLAHALGDRTRLPVVHIDLIHWQPGWVERSREEKTHLCREVEARETWIFEGGHSATWAERLARSDLLVWLDRPVALRVWRVLRRTWTGLGRNRPDLPAGCPEQFGTLPAFLRFIWRTRRTARDRMERLAGTATCPIVHLRSDQEIAAFLARFDPGRGKAC